MTPTRYPSIAQRKQTARRRDAAMKRSVEEAAGYTPTESLGWHPTSVYEIPNYIVRCKCGFISEEFGKFTEAEKVMTDHYTDNHHEGGEDA